MQLDVTSVEIDVPNDDPGYLLATKIARSVPNPTGTA
jgi:hypothetical protein